MAQYCLYFLMAQKKDQVANTNLWSVIYDICDKLPKNQALPTENFSRCCQLANPGPYETLTQIVSYYFLKKWAE